MYLNPQIHDTQDTLTIHVGYIGIPSRIRISSSACGRVWMREGTINLRYMYLIMYLGCNDVSRMFLDYPCRYMYLACIPHVSCISDTYLSRYLWDTRIPICILEVSRMYPSCILEPLQIHLSRMYPWLSCMYHVCILHVSSNLCRYMYPAWIPHVFRMYPLCILIVSWSVVMTRPRYMYRDFVSRCILMYRDEESKIHVSWCILICIQCDIKEAHRIHVSWCIWNVS